MVWRETYSRTLRADALHNNPSSPERADAGATLEAQVLDLNVSNLRYTMQMTVHFRDTPFRRSIAIFVRGEGMGISPTRTLSGYASSTVEIHRRSGRVYKYRVVDDLPSCYVFPFHSPYCFS
jgi:hypothetical protein